MANVVALGQVTGPRRLGLLPTQATGFVGREDELACLATLLRTSRLVTVAGPAGVGKTRLALRAAAEAAAGTGTASGSSTWAGPTTPVRWPARSPRHSA